MAVVVTDNRTIKDEADATTNWTAAGTSTGTATGTASPTPRESTAHVVTTATSSTPANQWLWHTGASLGTGPHLIYIWMLTTATIGTRANGGLMVLIGDGTNRVGYHVGGDDFAPFRVDSNGLVGYMCFCIDTAQLSTWPFGATVQAGTRAGLEANLNAITQIGTGCQVLAKALGGAVNYWNDIIRHGVATTISTSGLTISGGTSGSPGKFSEIEAEDRAITNQKAHGIIRQLGTGVFGIQGTLRFGDQGTGSSWFEETNVTCVFEDRGFDATRYKIVITDNGTGTTTFKLGTKVGSGPTAIGANGGSFISPPGVGAYFDSGTDTDVTDVFIYDWTFTGFSQGIVLGPEQEFIACNVTASGSVNGNGAIMVNTSISSPTVLADESALIWNVNVNTDGYLDGMSIAKGTNAHHAIELGLTSPTEITLRDFSSIGFNSANNQNDSTIYVKRTTGTVTINLVDTSGNFSYKTDGATVVIIANPVTTTVTVRDSSTGDPVEDAIVLLYASDATGDLPYLESVSITRSGSTATVTHTSHGLVTNNYVIIRGAIQQEYNGVKQITVINENSYTYEVLGTPTTPATGTITSTGVVIFGSTPSNGQLSDTRTFNNNQPVTGWVRKSTSSPLYRESSLAGNTISSISGLSINSLLIPDE